MNDLKKVFSFARAYRKDFAIAVALVCIETVFEMIIPLIMTPMISPISCFRAARWPYAPLSP